MKKYFVYIASLIMIIGCKPKVHIISFEDLNMESLSSCFVSETADDDFYLDFSVKNCTVEVISYTRGFMPDEYKRLLEKNLYDMEKEIASDTTHVKYKENFGRFLIPDGDGCIRVHSSTNNDLWEIMYHNGMPYYIKVGEKFDTVESITYEAEGFFSKYESICGDVYQFICGRYQNRYNMCDSTDVSF